MSRERFYLECPMLKRRYTKSLELGDPDRKRVYYKRCRQNLFKRWWPTGGLSLVEVGDEIPF